MKEWHKSNLKKNRKSDRALLKIKEKWNYTVRAREWKRVKKT